MQSDFLDLFFAVDGIGWIGPIGLVILGYFMAKESQGLGFIGFILQVLFMANYAQLFNAGEPAYIWHIFILLFGGLSTCLLPTILKR